MADKIDIEVRAFVAQYVSSVAKLELLLLLRREPIKAWSAAEAARLFALAPEMTANLLTELCRDGLATVAPDDPPLYRFAPPAPAVGQVLDRTIALYQERRVAMIQLIYGRPRDSLRSFADAFELKKKNKEQD
jgi:hypothetical protein